MQDVSLASAQALAASACPTAGISAEALQALDANGTTVPGTCASLGSGLTFTFAQNGLAAENAPGQGSAATTPASPSTAAPTTAR
jgi:hypothetical protein